MVISRSEEVLLQVVPCLDNLGWEVNESVETVMINKGEKVNVEMVSRGRGKEVKMEQQMAGDLLRLFSLPLRSLPCLV